uniref:Haloacid dehalogenase-like hydrolase domain-containing protein 2 n=1 Tax=Ciona savignyi TaxID=51511 RepID=H2YI78_CIOSA
SARMSRMLKNIKAVLVDLSGTLHIGDTAVHGAQDAIAKLRNHRLKIKFVTNTTKESLRSLHSRLQRLGFDIDPDEIYSSLTSARRVVEEQHLRPHLMLSDSAREDFDGVNVVHPNAVVMGLSPDHFNYDEMNHAMALLMGGAKLIAINKKRNVTGDRGVCSCTGICQQIVESIVIGKPQKIFFFVAALSMGGCGCPLYGCVMIGDDVRDDVGGAIEAGMMGMLVRSGKYRAGDEMKIGLSSELVVEDVRAAVKVVLASVGS